MKRILIVAQGTYGDVFPMIALGEALQESGHEVTLAVEEEYLELVKSRGLEGFVYVRGILATVQALPKGNSMPDVLRTVAEATPEAYAALAAWLDTHPVDLVIRHFFDMAALILVRERKLVYVNAFLSGASLFSRYDLPYSEDFKFMMRLAKVPGLARAAMKLNFRLMTLGSLRDYARFSRAKGVSPEASFAHVSPHYNLVLASKLLFPPQPDWPENVSVTGYAFLKGLEFDSAESNRFRQFVHYAGERPIIVTLGSSGLDDEVALYTQAVQSLRRVYPDTPLAIVAHEVIREQLRFPNVAVFDRIDYARVFPQAKLIFHQGGLGTTMEALRAGRPQVIISRLADRPDNGLRVERLGCGIWQPDLSSEVVAESRELLEPPVIQKCTEAALYIRGNPWKLQVRKALGEYLDR